MSNTLRKNLYCLLAIIIVSVLLMPANVFAADQEQKRNYGRHRMQEKGGPERRGQKKGSEHFEGERGRSDDEDRRRGPEGGKGPKHGNMDGKRHGKGREGHWKERMQKQHEEFVEWLTKNYPKMGKKLEKLKEKDPVGYIKQVGENVKKYGEIMKAEKKNPEYAKVLKDDMKFKKTRDQLLRKLTAADADEREGLQAELKETVAKRFDIVIRKKEFKYKNLKQKLEKLQKKVASRQAELEKLVQSKDKAIADRMKELVSESEKLNWD